ncbi:hypothetical protein SDC9_158172 [bioreactor metagenome]|uniref:Uncharacterized protein n=1 Tax=bioreactor metagenome TaxID=1076179 RepID=A0A645F916_9ZZZZ
MVKVPAPATSGNAIGTMDAAFASVCLWISIPKIISNAIMKMTKAPAMANEYTSTPMNFRILFPMKRNASINAPATIAALSDSIFPNFCFKPTITGSDPTMSITANKTIAVVSVSLMEKNSNIPSN